MTTRGGCARWGSRDLYNRPMIYHRILCISGALLISSAISITCVGRRVYYYTVLLSLLTWIPSPSFALLFFFGFGTVRGVHIICNLHNEVMS